MLAAVLITAALAGTSDWYLDPVVSKLHPIREPFLYRWQDNVSTVMSGSGASPLFRTSAARMDAHWRLAAYDTTPPLLLDRDRDLAIEHAGLGALLALQLSADQIITRSPEFAAIQRSLRTLTTPSIVVQKQGEETRVSLNERPRSQRAAMARIEEPGAARTPSASFRPPPGPQVRLTSGFRVVETTRTSSDGEDYTILRPGLNLSADADRLGPLSLRLRTSLLQEKRSETTIDWRAAARLSTVPRVFLIGDIQGSAALPSRVQTGVEWQLPTERSVNTRLTGSHRVEDAEQRLMLQVSVPMRWHIPSDLRRWPLGQEIDAVGGQPVLRKQVGPGPLVQLVPPEVARDAIVQQRLRSATELPTDEGS